EDDRDLGQRHLGYGRLAAEPDRALPVLRAGQADRARRRLLDRDLWPASRAFAEAGEFLPAGRDGLPGLQHGGAVRAADAARLDELGRRNGSLRCRRWDLNPHLGPVYLHVLRWCELPA